MLTLDEARQALERIPSLQVTRNEPLSRHTRFRLGGPAAVFADAASEDGFLAALRILYDCSLPWIVIGCGTNLIVADQGYPGVVLRYRGAAMRREGTRVFAEAGVPLQELVDFANSEGLAGFESLAGIPGNAGAAIYGNAGAYGTSMSDRVVSVRYFDGEQVREIDRDGCGFRYRESVFKRRRQEGSPWVLLSAEFELAEGDSAALKARSEEILALRNAKYPPEMMCAGSIFKNLILADLPEPARKAVPAEIVKGGKVPSAWFLERAGAKGLSLGGIHVADYHANLIFHDGGGSASQAVELIAALKEQVSDFFGVVLEEEVQYVGFKERLPGVDQLSTMPHVVQGLLVGLTPEELRWKPAADRWSVSEVLAHLAHCERVCFAPRMRAMVEQDDPAIEAYDPYELERQGTYQTRFALAALEDFLKARHESLEYLRNVPLSAAARTARHPQLGRITLGEMMNEWAFHDLGHIRQISELARAVKYYPSMGPFRSQYTVNP
ncbi:MAG: UDP-N-acetylmuramate dehydrogenase [Bryobacteraceae bacterium]|nr:UDP-N-acetylmuramate dehydrogenase [Bryobacteraceae bacterium]